MYADTKLSANKQYSYMEWTFYLRLLGESESDGSLHRRARPKPKGQPHHDSKGNRQADDAGANRHEHQVSKEEENPGSPKWSWIGPRSPLMHEDNEAEWILKRLFQKLEESLRRQALTAELPLDDPEHEHGGRNAET